MEKKIRKASILTGTIITGALFAITINAEARPATLKVLGNGAELRSAIIDLNITSSADNEYELKCGTETPVTKKAESKEVKDKSTEAKCGSDDSTKAKVSDDKKDTKAVENKAVSTKDVKDKTGEAKCGEGKCGESKN